MNLAENLKRIRKENNLSQEEFAEKLGVSRQSVSKWESNSAYPEMDKLIQISNIFNIGIDELINKDIREVREDKQSKINIQKTIDDFLEFITKSVDMFINMKFRQKLKFIFEEVVISLIFLILFFIIGTIFSRIFYNLFGFINYSLYSVIYDIFTGIYIILFILFSFTIILHIYKTRYLDYYIIVDKENMESYKEINTTIKQQLVEHKHEKIIIRDSNHSISRFISKLCKIFLILIKINVGLFLLAISFILVGFSVALILSFSIIKTGMFFIGLFICILSIITILISVMNVLFNFIVNRKTKSRLIFITFLVCLITLGSGVGISLLGFSKFNITYDSSQKDEKVIPMKDNLIIHELYDDNVKFVESNDKNLRIVVNYSKDCKINYYTVEDNNNDFLYIFLHQNYKNSFDLLRKKLDEFNQKKIVDSHYYYITIYTTAENINKLRTNYDNWRNI